MTKFYRVENIKSLTIFKSIANALGRMDIPLTDCKVRFYYGQSLIQKIWAASNIGQNGHFFEKREPKISPPPIQFLFLVFQIKIKH